MRNIIIFILLGYTITTFGQKKATLVDGTNIIVYPDGTWKYDNETASDTSEIKTTEFTINLDGYKEVYSKPSIASRKIKNFPDEDIKIIDYFNNFFLIKSKSGKMGYILYIYVDNYLDYQFKLTEASIEKAKNKEEKILIKGVSVEKINSASGVDFSVEWGYFDHSKDIKYIYFTVAPYNLVGDLQKCDISGHSTFTGKVTGPIESEEKFINSYWSTAWYNNTIGCIKLTKVKVEYTDGTNYIYVNELPNIMDDKYVNKCN